MLSQLSKGYGSWTAGYVDPYFGDKKAHPHEREFSFPEIDQESHIHGVTVGSRSGRSTAMTWATTRHSREPTLDGIPLPKTYTTRQGALQLYVGPEDLDSEVAAELEEDRYALKPKYMKIKRPQGQELIDLSLKLGTMERLAMSVLQFGDQEYDHEHTSVSDAKNKAFLKFLHEVDKGTKPLDIDSSVQPGGDLNNYLRDLRSSASNRSSSMHISKSRESLELQAILRGLDNSSNWPMSFSQDGASDRQSSGQFTRPVSRVSSRGPSPGPPSTPRSTYQVLSAKKVCASIKSSSYLGRPSSMVSAYNDDLVEGEIPRPATSATISRPIWSPKESTDELLTDARNWLSQGEDEGDSDGGKRRGLKERSFLTNNSQLYKGRNARKGEGQRANEVKVTVSGEGDNESQCKNLSHIKEELGESCEAQKTDEELKRYHSVDGLHEVSTGQCPDIKWAERVSSNSYVSEDHHHLTDRDENSEGDSSDIIDVEVNDKPSEEINQEAYTVRNATKIKQEVNLEKNAVNARSQPSSGEVRIRSRPCSGRSTGSSESTNTRTPSIITLQSYDAKKKPSVKQEKYYDPQRRRNTYTYDQTKGLVRTQMTRRKSVHDPVKQISSSNMDISFFQYQQKSQSYQGADKYNDYYEHPVHVSSKSNNDWSAARANSNTHSDWPEHAYVDTMDARVDDNYVLDSNSKHALNTSIDDYKSTEKAMNEFDDNAETAFIDQEEYVLDNIAECNEEIKQIEALAEEQMSEDSDSGSSMDEEMIKVILGGGKPSHFNGHGEEENTEEDLVVVERETEENKLKSDERKAEEDEDFINVEVNDNTSKENDQISETAGGGGLGDGQVADSDSGEQKDLEENSVDEENASDIGSTRSGKKTRSRRSRSRVSTEEGDEAASGSEYVLPALESDRFLQEKDAHAIVAELDALGLGPKSGKGLTYPLLPPGKRPKVPAEKTKIPDHIAEALSRQTDASREYLEQDLERRGFLKDGKVTAMVGESLSGPTLEAIGEGLTEEELELAKQILQQKIDEAKGKLDGKQPVAKTKSKKVVKGGAKKGGKKKKGQTIVEEKSPDELNREALREKHEQETKQREKEAAELQKKIAEKRRLMMEQEDITSARSKELKEEMERLEREAEAIQRAEDEAREILADVRKKQREEREARRKADLERKKQEALERREREKKELEEKRRKEAEMMEKIADADMRRRMREEEERRIAEEERLAQERYEDELREAQRLEEEEEERLREMERQAEEEAMQRLIEEREAAERERRRIRDEEEALQEAERLKMLAMEAEHQRLEAERRKIEEAELAKKEAERQRLLELRRLEEEARMKMQEEIERRRSDALARRDYNLENRQHIDKLKNSQGITRAWTFSYFVHWPRETYESKLRPKLGLRRNRPIGEPDPRKVVKINNPKPKKVIDTPADVAEAPTQTAT